MRVFVHTYSELKLAVFVVLLMSYSTCYKHSFAFIISVDKAIQEAVFHFYGIGTACILGFEFAFFFKILIVVYSPIICVQSIPVEVVLKV